MAAGIRQEARISLRQFTLGKVADMIEVIRLSAKGQERNKTNNCNGFIGI